jgi:hypothetical protein
VVIVVVAAEPVGFAAMVVGLGMDFDIDNDIVMGYH